MKMKLLAGVLVFLILVNLATIGSYLYFRWMRGGPERPVLGPPPMMELDPMKRSKLLELLRAFQDETEARQASIHRLEDETFALLQRDVVPEDSVSVKLKQISEVRLEIGQLAVRRLIEAKSFLTPEQQRIFFGAIVQSRPGPPGGPQHGHPPPGFDGMRRGPPDFPPGGPPPERR